MQRLDDGRRELAGRIAFRGVLVGNRRDGFRAVDEIRLNDYRQRCVPVRAGKGRSEDRPLPILISDP